jgi:hypothetical protein
MIARANATAAAMQRLDDAKYRKPATPRRFAPADSPEGNMFTLAPSGVVWYTFRGGMSTMTPYNFRDLMNMVAKMEVREVSHEYGGGR